MKKALPLILALVLCLSLCACNSGNNNENKTSEDNENTITQNDNNNPQAGFVGEWKGNVLVGNSGDGREYEVAVIQLNEDGTGTYKDKALTWELSEDGKAINFTITKDNTTGNFKIQTIDGKTTLNFYQDIYYRASEFEEKTDNDAKTGAVIGSRFCAFKRACTCRRCCG